MVFNGLLKIFKEIINNWGVQGIFAALWTEVRSDKLDELLSSKCLKCIDLLISERNAWFSWILRLNYSQLIWMMTFFYFTKSILYESEPLFPEETCWAVVWHCREMLPRVNVCKLFSAFSRTLPLCPFPLFMVLMMLLLFSLFLLPWIA